MTNVVFSITSFPWVFQAVYDRFTARRLQSAYGPVRGAILADGTLRCCVSLFSLERFLFLHWCFDPVFCSLQFGSAKPEMGLGKTLQTLGLILGNPPEGHAYGHNADWAEGPICTLIVCPVSVISNWNTQIDDYVRMGTFRVETYTGNRNRRSKIVEKVLAGGVDILISSYETISSEFEKENDTLGIHNASFWRIVLDEAQWVRNSKSKAFRAISAVANKSQRRLALTGTPFVNSPDDIYSLLSFLGLDPLSDHGTFKSFITDPIKDRKRAGLTRLRAALGYVALRRTKNGMDLELATKTVNVSHIDFPEGANPHRYIHDVLYTVAHASFEASINGKGKEYTESEGGISATASQALFEFLLRVRQSCCDGRLIPSDRFLKAEQVMKTITLEDGRMKNLTAKEGNRIIDFLMSAKDDDNAEATTSIAPDNIKEHSPKINALLSALGGLEDDEKAVVFSQVRFCVWSIFLKLLLF